MNDARTIADDLLEVGAFKISLDPLFTWTSGLKSPVYCDLRALISALKSRQVIVSAMVEMIRNGGENPDVIAGTATAGIPWAAWIAERLNKPMVYVRGEAKAHGTKKRIEGILPQGKKVILIEDHISTGKSSISAIKALREEGRAIVNTIYAINTYELEKAAQAFDKEGVKVKTVTNYSVILEAAKESGLVDASKLVLLADFKRDPETWAERHDLT